MPRLTIRIKNVRYFVDKMLVYIVFALTLALYLFQYSTAIYYMRLGFLTIGALSGYNIAYKKKFYYPWILAIFFSSCWLLCLLFRPSAHLGLSSGVLFCTVCYIGFSILLLEGSYDLLGSCFLLLICVGVIIFRFLNGVSSNNILVANSRNYISVLILFVLLLYYFALQKRGEKNIIFLLFPAIVFLIVSFMALGRGGILTSGFLLALLLIYISTQTGDTLKVLLRFFSVLIIACVIILYFSQNGLLSQFLTRFNISISNEPRLQIWSNYFQNTLTSFRNFIFGTDASVVYYDANLHNSFLQCYANYGFIAFIALILLCANSLRCAIKQKNYFLLILETTLFLRAFTDRLFYQGYCEVFLYYFLMYYDYKKCARKIGNSISDNG